VCARSCVSMQEDCSSTPGTDKANQAFHPFGVGEIGSSLYKWVTAVEDFASPVQIEGLFGIIGSYRDL
jgi:hypothetical protein